MLKNDEFSLIMNIHLHSFHSFLPSFIDHYDHDDLVVVVVVHRSFDSIVIIISNNNVYCFNSLN